MNTKRWMAFLPLLLGALLTAGCYYMPSGTQGSARVSMALGKGMPGNVSSIALIVSGPDMKTMANEYPVGTTSVSLEVPAGLARTFTVLANTPSATLRGDATADLVAGEKKEIMLSPVLFDSQIIVPDPYSNYRLVQISDMAGTGWTAVTYSNLGIATMTSLTQFVPYDVDFDSQGRIYIANNFDGVVRMNDINDTAAKWDLRGIVSASPVSAIAIDRTNDILYFANGSSLAKIDVAAFGTAPTPTPLSGHTATYITGLAVGPDGSLYLTNYGYGNGGSLIKYDPVGQKVITSYSDGTNWDPWDVSVQNGYVYTTHVLYFSGAKKVARSGLDLSFIDDFTGSGSDPFYGPRRFVAILSRKLTVIDEGYVNLTDSNRLAAFSDMSGSGWTSYGTTGSSTDQFEFFSQYFC